MFVGRNKELKLLEDAYRSEKSELVVLYGRRRIGKSSLIRRFSDKRRFFYGFEAIEGELTAPQIRHFTGQLRRQVDDPLLDTAPFRDWDQVFAYMTDRLFKRKGKVKKILFLDELQWMAVGRNKLVSMLKFFWDNNWKEKNVMLILCGSIASFMVDKVLRSKALYGRTTLEILLSGLAPEEAPLLLGGKRSREEALKYQLVFGGVPKYLEQVNPNRSFNQNINRLCFSPHGLMVGEIDRIFYSQFREPRTYIRIIHQLKKGILTQKEIAVKAKIASGGGLNQYLRNLELADIICSFTPHDRGANTKLRKYGLSDEFLIFYFKYIEPNRRIIDESRSERLFETLAKESFDSWLGFAFERFCLKHAGKLSAVMGFAEDVLLASPYFRKEDKGFQIDLLYRRADRVITLCEIKHRNSEIKTSVIPEVERKCALLSLPRGYTLEKALISLHGPDRALLESGYFHHHVTLEDLFGTAH